MLGTMKRIMLFVLTNILVIAAVSTLIQVLGLQPYLSRQGVDYMSLLVFCGLFGFVGSFISLQMSRWSAKMAMGVQLIDPENPSGATERRIVDLVRSLCTRNHLRDLPEIGIYQSPELNAFATGPSASRALLAISSGLLQRMDDPALEGVIGHEIGHIANGDMVTMTLLQGVVNTFVMFFARVLVFALDNFLRDRDNRRGGGLGWFGQFMAIQLLQSVLMLLASPLIYFYSRRREYAADALSARTTGRQNMIRALETLKRYTQIEDNRAPSLSTFKINGRGYGLVAMLYASHPPLDARIAALRKLG